jgi:hypothetical protein
MRSYVLSSRIDVLTPRMKARVMSERFGTLWAKEGREGVGGPAFIDMHSRDVLSWLHRRFTRHAKRTRR